MKTMKRGWKRILVTIIMLAAMLALAGMAAAEGEPEGLRRPVVTVSGEADDGCWINEVTTILIDATDARMLFLTVTNADTGKVILDEALHEYEEAWRGDEYAGWGDRHQSVTERILFGDPGNYVITVRGYWGSLPATRTDLNPATQTDLPPEDDPGWQETTVEIEVLAETGTPGEADISLNNLPESGVISRGELLSVTVTPAEGVMYCSAAVFAADEGNHATGDSLYVPYRKKGEAYQIPTWGLPNNCVLQVISTTPRHPALKQEIPFTVDGDVPTQVAWALSKNEVDTDEPFSVGVYIPGAEYVYLEIYQGTYYAYNESTGSAVVCSGVKLPYDDTEVQIVAHGQDWNTGYVCDEVLTINDAEDAPIPFFVNTPTILTAGEDVTITLEVDDSKITKGPITYDVMLNYQADYPVATATSSADTVTVTVPWSVFEDYGLTEPGTNLTVYVRAHGQGYNAKDNQKSFVIGGQQSAGFQIDGQTESTVNFYVGEYILFEGSLAGARMFQLDITTDEDEPEILQTYEIGADEIGWAGKDLVFRQPGYYRAYGYAYCWEGAATPTDLGEGIRTKTIRFHVDSMGPVLEEGTTLVKGQVADSVTQGEILEVPINWSEHAERVHAAIYAGNTVQGDPVAQYESFPKNDLILPTWNLNPGTYCAEITMSGWRYEDVTQTLGFTVNSPAEPIDPEAIQWSLLGVSNGAEIDTETPFTVGVYCPGADAVTLIAYCNDYENIDFVRKDEEWATLSPVTDRSGTITFKVMRTYRGDDGKQHTEIIASPYTLTVKEGIQAPTPTITSGRNVAAGQPYSFSFTEGEKEAGKDYSGMRYDLKVYQMNFPDNKIELENLQPGSTQIPWEKLADIGATEGNTLIFELTAHGIGYYPASASIEAPVTGIRDEQFRIGFAGENWPDHAQTEPGTFFTIQLEIPEGTENFAVWNDYWHTWETYGSTTELVMNPFYYLAEVPIIARYRTDEGYRYSNMIYLTVQCGHRNGTYQSTVRLAYSRYVPWEGENANIGHDIYEIAVDVTYCKTCGAELERGEPYERYGGNFQHAYEDDDSNVCLQCGHVSTCQHESVTPYKYMYYEVSAEEIEGNDEYHLATGEGDDYDICDICHREFHYRGETVINEYGWTTTYITDLMPHSYTDGVCTTCGHRCGHSGETHTEFTLVQATGGATEIAGDDRYHSVTADGTETVICSLCGKALSTAEKTGYATQQEHDYDDEGVCTQCGHRCGHSNSVTQSGEANCVYAWQNPDTHRVGLVASSWTECEDCGTVSDEENVPVYAYETYNEAHFDVDGDGLCDRCGGRMTDTWGWDDEGSVLFITGSGAIPDFVSADENPWNRLGIADLFRQVVVGENITGIGANAFAGMKGTVRFEMDQATAPTTAEEAFNGTDAICRYYAEWNEDDVPDNTTATWVYLPVDNRNRLGNQLVYERENGWSFYWNDGIHPEQQITYVTPLQAKELTFQDRSVHLYALPATAEDESVFDISQAEGGVWVDFADGCEGNYTLTIPASVSREQFLDLEMTAPKLNLTVTDQRDIPLSPYMSGGIRNFMVDAGSITVNGNVQIIILQNTGEEKPNILINGDVREINFYDATSKWPFGGSLTVTGQVLNGTRYGKYVIAVPRIGNVVFDDVMTTTFSQDAQTEQPYTALITEGMLTGGNVTEIVPTIDMFDYRYQYDLGRDEWMFELRPKENSVFGTYGATVYNVRANYNPKFTMDDIIWGDQTELCVYSFDEMNTETVEINGQDGVGVKELLVTNAKVKINCPVHKLTMQGWSNVNTPVDVEINSTMDECYIYLHEPNSVVRLGANGLVRYGIWDRQINGNRQCGPVSGKQDLFRDGRLCVLNWKPGQATKAILAGDREVTEALGTAAAGKTGSMEVTDFSYNAMDPDEKDALDGLLDGKPDEVASVFDVSVKAYTLDDEGNADEGVAISELTKPVGITVENTTGGNAYVVRLHEDENGEMTAEQITPVTNGSTIPFSSKLFSKYAVVEYKGTAVDPETLEKKMILPAGLKRIESGAFDGIGAQAVFIPAGCEYIGPGAFVNCDSLTYVEYYEGTEVAADAFEKTIGLEIIVKKR